MPDPALWTEAMGVSALAAFVVFTLFTLARSSVGESSGWRSTAASTIALGLGMVVGCAILGIRPHWPLLEDQDRLLAIVLPLAMGVELAAASTWPRRLAFAGRIGVSGTTASILLHGTTYLSDLTGPESREWPPALAGTILTGLAMAQFTGWLLAWRLAARSPGSSHLAGLAIVILGSSLAVMMSGYATGGLIGLPVAGALGGLAMAARLSRPALRHGGPILVAVTGLASILVIGRFLGQLGTCHAVLLFAAPLLGWVPELIPGESLSPLVKASARLALVTTLVAGVVLHASQRFLDP